MKVDLIHETREAEQRLRGYRGGLDRVLVRTLNRVMPTATAQAARLVSVELAVPVGAAKRALKVNKANVRRLYTDMGADRKRLPLIRFRARQTRQGVTYQIGKRPRALLPRAFINVGPKAGRTVLKRAREDQVTTGKVRAPGVAENLVPRDPALIKYGPSIARVFLEDALQKVLATTARARWVRELAAQVNFFLGKKSGGGK
jgi:hypothetical protein